MRRAVRILLALVGLGGVAAGVALLVLYRASQEVPDFYEEALAVAPAVHEQAGENLEQQVQTLQQEVTQVGRWEMLFSDRQINGWLAYELPRRFAAALPRGVSEPRVAIQPDRILVACRYDTKKVSSVVSLELETMLTDEPNVVAVRVKSVKAGSLPLPVSQFLDQITTKAAKADLDIRWLEEDGEPVALLTIPAQHEQYRYKTVLLEQLECRDGEVFLAGRTESESSLLRTAAVTRRNNRWVE
ncbi:MAG: hypothetical protein KDA62_01010 [Planctomycetales bacterium]|nr:hypothetical protein [Planctomycetales bacterium]